jgi:uncharacterized protein (DUF1697 family)
VSAKAALLTGVNLGKRKVVMSELRARCEGAGFKNVRTLLASGNLVLDSRLAGDQLETKLEKLIAEGLGLKTIVHVRDHAELEAVIAANPFPAMAEEDPSHLVVIFTRAAPSAAAKKALEAPQGGPEEVRVIGRDVFVAYPAGIGRSELKLKVAGTMRNWNTVTKLAAMTAPA